MRIWVLIAMVLVCSQALSGDIIGETDVRKIGDRELLDLLKNPKAGVFIYWGDLKDLGRGSHIGVIEWDSADKEASCRLLWDGAEYFDLKKKDHIENFIAAVAELPKRSVVFVTPFLASRILPGGKSGFRSKDDPPNPPYDFRIFRYSVIKERELIVVLAEPLKTK